MWSALCAWNSRSACSSAVCLAPPLAHLFPASLPPPETRLGVTPEPQLNSSTTTSRMLHGMMATALRLVMMAPHSLTTCGIRRRPDIRNVEALTCPQLLAHNNMRDASPGVIRRTYLTPGPLWVRNP